MCFWGASNFFLQPAVLLYGSMFQFNKYRLDIGESGRLHWDPTFARTLFSSNNGGERLAPLPPPAPLFTAAARRRLSPLHRIFVQYNILKAVSSHKIMQNKWPMTFPVCVGVRDAPSTSRSPTHPHSTSSDFDTASEDGIYPFLAFHLWLCRQQFWLW